MDVNTRSASDVAVDSGATTALLVAVATAARLAVNLKLFIIIIIMVEVYHKTASL